MSAADADGDALPRPLKPAIDTQRGPCGCAVITVDRRCVVVVTCDEHVGKVVVEAKPRA